MKRKELVLVIGCISVELIKCVPMAGLPIPIDKHDIRILILFKDIIIVACDSGFMCLKTRNQPSMSRPQGVSRFTICLDSWFLNN